MQTGYAGSLQSRVSFGAARLRPDVLDLVRNGGLLSHLLSRGEGECSGAGSRATIRCYLQLLALTRGLSFDLRALDSLPAPDP